MTLQQNSRSEMEFGSTFIFAPTDSSQEYEHIPETQFNHVVTGYASGASVSTSSSLPDDGEVSLDNNTAFIFVDLYRHVCGSNQDWCYFCADLFVGHSGHCRTGGVFSNAGTGIYVGA